MKSKKMFLIAGILFSTLATPIVGVFAYFNLTKASTNITIDKDLNSDIIKITSFDDLIKYAKNETFNNKGEVDSSIEDNSPNRKTLQLQNDIVITNSLTITSDCNLDLNGHILYLNGYDITYNHKFYGTIQLYSSVANGIIIPEQVEYINDGYQDVTDAKEGKFIIYTPNAILTTNKNITCKVLNNYEGSSLSEEEKTLSNYINVIESSSLYTCYDAYNLISEKLLNYTDIRPSKTNLDELKVDSSTIVQNDNQYTFSSSLFIPTRVNNETSYCDYESSSHACSFVFSDLDLPFTYYNYEGISISYTSSNQDILSNYGKIVSLPTTEKDVTLEATISINEEEVATSSFLLHVVNPSSSSDMVKVSKTMFYERIKNHFNSEEGQKQYRFDKEIILPTKIGDNTTLSYLPYSKSSASGAVTIFDGDSTTYKSLGTSSLTEMDNGLVNFAPSSELAALEITITNGSSKEVFYIKCASENNSISNESTLAKNLLNEWYGGTITLEKTEDATTKKVNYSTVQLYSLKDIDTSSYPGITSLRYEIVNDGNSLYQISDIESSDRKLLSVVDGKTPENYVQDVKLACIFTINGKTTNIHLNVKVKTAGDETINAFMPYYYYYDEYLKNNYNNYISNTFELPFAYSSSGPIVVLDVVTIPSDYDASSEDEDAKTISKDYINKEEGITLKLYYNGSVQNTFVRPTDGSSYTDLLDSYLKTNNVTLKQILSYGDAKWIYSLNIEDISNKNKSLALIYSYKSNANTSNWTTYCEGTSTAQILTTFTLAGVLHFGNDVTNETFYKWIYDNYNTNDYTYAVGDYTKAASDTSNGKYVLIDWLNQDISIDATTDSVISSISDFTGIQYLTGCTSLNLTGLITDEDSAIKLAREIAKMSNLETLNLKNCTGFSEGFNTSTNTADDNDSISRFVNLKNLSYLNLEGCNIYEFDFLDQMTWLTEVHIANQQVSSNTSLATFYGSTGITNYWVFGDLTSAGVSVYNTYQGTGEVLFEESTTTNDYTRLNNGVVYQGQLKEGKDISSLYSSFSTTPDDYLLAKYYNSNKVTKQKITWSYVEYLLTSDKEIDTTKTYYTREYNSSTSSYVYTEVSSPDVENIGLYYEKYDQYNAKAFQVTYTFTVGGSNINLTVKFDVIRY